MKTSEQVDKILAKLFKVKANMNKLKKDANNPFFKSQYADLNSHLDEVEPLLSQNNLLLLQPVNIDSVATFIYDVESGQYVSSAIKIDGKDMQQLGAAVTYARRFTLGALLGMQAIDDDGNFASGKTTKLEVEKKETKVETQKAAPTFRRPTTLKTQPVNNGDDDV